MMTTSRPNPQPSGNRSTTGPLSTANGQPEDGVSPDDLAEKRAERLAAITAAVHAGHYDSDEMLEKALGIMLSRIDADSADC